MCQERIVEIFKDKIFKPMFWERKNSPSMEEIYVQRVEIYITNLFEISAHTNSNSATSGASLRERIMNKKTPNITSIKSFKKYIKNIHIQVPNYLKNKEKERKKKDQIPVEFMSDDEMKEEEVKVDGFKPPKPMKPGKRTMSMSKIKESTPVVAPPILEGNKEMKMDVDGEKNAKEVENDMEICLTIPEDND